MDPYLERHWGDVHHSLVQYACEILQSALPDDLRARVEERVFLESEPWRDLSATEPLDAQISPRAMSSVAQPTVFEALDVEITEGYIQIQRRGGGEVVTFIDFLTPANKMGGVGQQQYLAKQDEVLRSDASLVEIDLVRVGNSVVAFPAPGVPPKYRTDYVACISPGWKRNRREIYAMPLRQRLPALPIPLRQNESRVTLDLQALIERAYQAGRYDDIDYAAELTPLLPAEDAVWARELIQSRPKK
jgi:hypothetical protein